MIKLEVNCLEFLVKSNTSVLEACKYIGIKLPRFCYHETLSVAGNCRICVVEVVNSPKPVASCALPVLNNMKIFVDTPLVKKARENVIETLLINHPLDCPICDQGGECDLQDQTQLYGSDHSRFFFKKRGVENKYCGPLIKTIMTRCIHCTRCVRFSVEIAGVPFLGTLNRGTSTEIGGYLSGLFNSEISGNVIDLCPVGALTSKSYAFKARPWELRVVESVDCSDSTGSSIYVHFKESEIFRITPKINKDINDNLISDKARFSFDSNSTQRVAKPFEYNKLLKIHASTDWVSILEQFENKLNSNENILFLVNNNLDYQSLNLLKRLSKNYSTKIDIQNIDAIGDSLNSFNSWIFNKISDLKQESKLCFLVSSNIRVESAIINSKLRIKYVNKDLNVFSLSQKFNSNFNTQFINLNINNLVSIFEGKNKSFAKLFLLNKAPIVCLGESITKRNLSVDNIVFSLKRIMSSCIFLNIKNGANSSLDFLNIKSFNLRALEKSKTVVAVNLEDTLSALKYIFLQKSYNIFWLTTHGSKLALRSNYILPILSEFEEEKIFVNLEGRPQKTLQSVSGTENMRSLQKFLSIFTGKSISTSNSFVSELVNNPSVFDSLKTIFNLKILMNSVTCKNMTILNMPTKPIFEDFYRSSKGSKNSLTMSKCSQESRGVFNNFN
jgi:NADH-quinone oxidoreductase chain G